MKSRELAFTVDHRLEFSSREVGAQYTRGADGAVLVSTGNLVFPEIRTDHRKLDYTGTRTSIDIGDWVVLKDDTRAAYEVVGIQINNHNRKGYEAVPPDYHWNPFNPKWEIAFFIKTRKGKKIDGNGFTQRANGYWSFYAEEILGVVKNQESEGTTLPSNPSIRVRPGDVIELIDPEAGTEFRKYGPGDQAIFVSNLDRWGRVSTERFQVLIASGDEPSGLHFFHFDSFVRVKIPREEGPILRVFSPSEEN